MNDETNRWDRLWGRGNVPASAHPCCLLLVLTTAQVHWSQPMKRHVLLLHSRWLADDYDVEKQWRRKQTQGTRDCLDSSRYRRPAAAAAAAPVGIQLSGLTAYSVVINIVQSPISATPWNLTSNEIFQSIRVTYGTNDYLKHCRRYRVWECFSKR